MVQVLYHQPGLVGRSQCWRDWKLNVGQLEIDAVLELTGSSIGRTPDSESGGCRFDSYPVSQLKDYWWVRRMARHSAVNRARKHLWVRVPPHQPYRL